MHWEDGMSIAEVTGILKSKFTLTMLCQVYSVYNAKIYSQLSVIVTMRRELWFCHVSSHSYIMVIVLIT